MTKDFYLEVAKGNIPGHSAVNKFGHNPVATNLSDVWAGLGTYPFYPLTAQAMELVSSATQDEFASGIGAKTVMVFGLDSNWDEISETVELDGQDPVDLQNTYLRIHRAVVVTAGEWNTNYGNITIEQDGAAGDTAAYISAGDGQTQQAIYTIPNGKTGYFIKGYVGISDNDKSGEAAQFKWRAKANNGVNGAWATKGQISCTSIGSSWWQYEYGIPAGPLPEKTDIRLECSSVTAAMGVVGGYDILMVDD
jgi:hypothetical protein